MNVKQMMTNQVSTCNRNTPLSAIATAMWHNDCGSIPVVDENHCPVAMVTDRDIAIGAALQQRPLWELTPNDIADNQLLHKCHLNDDVQTALDIMRENGVRRLPVVNDQGTLTGIVSAGDVIAAANSAENSELPFYRTESMLKAVAGHSHSLPLMS
ncbi:CBS domain-containing protein [Porticoccaceae bacterium]|nr:CBS domain-containing protein [Porticoccaceae bacterium]MDC1514028.1 CBS domain-containing protein [Porticoccaceae bacterium]